MGRKKIVETKFMEERILLAPAKCKEKIIKSVETEGAAGNELYGGYKVQPEAAPKEVIEESIEKIKEKNSSQNERLLILGRHISATWKHKGIKRLDKPPILKGITKKKII